MPYLLLTTTKPVSTDPWIISYPPYAEACCTEEEMNSVILPFRNTVESIPGYISTTITEIDDVTINIRFDMEALDSIDRLINAVANVERKTLMQSKRAEINSSPEYVYTQTAMIGGI
jgi:hypothetical protein